MSALHQARCFNHALREAVARCPGCRRFYCRECVTEHGDRFMCAACITAETKTDSASGSGWQKVIRCFQALVGLAIIWFAFLLLGQTLLEAPSQFHEGTMWRQNWWDME